MRSNAPVSERTPLPSWRVLLPATDDRIERRVVGKVLLGQANDHVLSRSRLAMT